MFSVHERGGSFCFSLLCINVLTKDVFLWYGDDIAVVTVITSSISFHSHSRKFIVIFFPARRLWRTVYQFGVPTKKDETKNEAWKGGLFGICRWRGLSKNLRYDWFEFSHACFPGISGRFLFLHTKKFHISNYYYFYVTSLECIHSLQGSLLQIFALQVSPLTCPLSKCFSLQNVFPNSTISCDPWSSLTRLTEWNRFQSRTILPLGGNAWAWKEAESSKGPRVLSEGFTLAWCGCTFPWLFGPP